MVVGWLGEGGGALVDSQGLRDERFERKVDVEV